MRHRCVLPLAVTTVGVICVQAAFARRGTGLAIVCLAILLAVTAQPAKAAVSIQIDPATYDGQWELEGVTELQTGPKDISIEPGRHHLIVGSRGGNQISFDLEVAENSTVRVLDSGIAKGSFGKLTFQPGIRKLDDRVEIVALGKPLRDLLQDLEGISGVRFHVSPRIADDRILVAVRGEHWRSAIEELLASYNSLSVIDSDNHLRRVSILRRSSDSTILPGLPRPTPDALQQRPHKRAVVSHQEDGTSPQDENTGINPLFLAPDEAEPSDRAARRKAPATLFRRIADEGPQVISVTFSDPNVPAFLAQFPEGSVDRISAMEAAYQAVEGQTLASVEGVQPELLNQLSHTRIALMRVTSSGELMNLLRRRKVTAVFEQKMLVLHLAETLPHIQQPLVLSGGHSGEGTEIAILDTGVDSNHPDFDGHAVTSIEIAPDDGALDDAGHGTNVAAIVARTAPKTDIVMFDVFRWVPSEGEVRAFGTDIKTALNQAIARKQNFANIVAVNLSLGSGKSGSPCPFSFFAVVLEDVRQAGILPVVSSGNDGFIDGIGDPACVPGAVSVGRVNSGEFASLPLDTVFDSSNSASFLTLLAPGTSVAAGGLTFSGTSMSAPHVAGAVALLRAPAAFPSDTLDQTVARMTSGGVPVTDHRNGLTFPRLDLAGAFGIGAVALNVQATDAVFSDKVVITWAFPNIAASFRVFRSDTFGGSKTELTSIAITTKTWTDTTGLPAKRYHYWVRAGTSTELGHDIGFKSLGSAVSAAKGFNHSLLLRADGQVLAWGDNAHGQLGDGTTVSKSQPGLVRFSDGTPLDSVKAVKAFSLQSYALTAEGLLYGWGDNDDGLSFCDARTGICKRCGVGDGGAVDRLNPVIVLTGIVDIEAVVGRFVATTSGQALHYVCGADWDVELVSGAVDVGSFDGIRLVNSTVMTKDFGRRVCSDPFFVWALVGSGQTTESFTPLTGVTQISAGQSFSVALLGDGSVRTWGVNSMGQLGTGNGLFVDPCFPTSAPESFSYEPVVVKYANGTPLTGAVAVAASKLHALAILDDGSVVSWGADGVGQGGDGEDSEPNNFNPVKVIGENNQPIMDVVNIATSDFMSIAMKSDGTTLAWGILPSGVISHVAVPILFDDFNNSFLSSALPTVDLSVSVDAKTKSSASGGNTTFTINVSNTGGFTATDVRVEVAPPNVFLDLDGSLAPLLSFTSSAGSCVLQDDIIVCSIGNLERDQAVTVTVTVNSPVDFQLQLAVDVDSNELDLVQENNFAQIDFTVEPLVIVPWLMLLLLDD